MKPIIEKKLYYYDGVDYPTLESAQEAKNLDSRLSLWEILRGNNNNCECARDLEHVEVVRGTFNQVMKYCKENSLNESYIIQELTITEL